MKYIVKTTCFYQNRLYKKGEVVDFSTTPPKHFEPLEDKQTKLSLGTESKPASKNTKKKE